MALLIASGLADWIPDAELRDEVLSVTPDADVRVADAPGDTAQVTMLAATALPDPLPWHLPNLQLVQKLGAGVETIVHHPALPPHIRVTRLKPEEPARQIAEFCLAYVLREQRNLEAHAEAQRRAAWTPIAPRRASETHIAVLGLGHIGGLTARLFRDLGYQVSGWASSAHSIDGVHTCAGADALRALLGQADYVAAILPSTPRTRGLFDADLLGAMKPGAMLINAGRGDLIDEAALCRALDQGRPGHAVLDVVSAEPLPANSPLWRHPAVTLTPHVSGWHLGDALADVAENYRRLSAGAPLLHEVDRTRGY